jgi:hypothetical protein
LKIVNAQASGVGIDLTGLSGGYAIDLSNNQFLRFAKNTGTLGIIFGVGVDNNTLLMSHTGQDIYLKPDLGVTTGLTVKATSGNVGIGTTSPLTKLSVVGTAGANDILDLASSTGASVLRVTGAGNVGIGTIAPSYALDVRSNTVDNIGWGGTDAARGVLSWSSGTARVFATP